MTSNPITALASSEDVALPSGRRMPLLGFGTWQITGDEATRAVTWALEAVVVIPKSRDRGRIGSNADIGVALSPVDMAALDALGRQR